MCKGRALSALVLGLLLSLAACNWQPDILGGGERKWLEAHGPLKVGVFAEYPPYSFVGPEKVPMGIGVEVWRAMAQKLGFEVEFKVMPLEEQLEALAQGRLDSLVGIFPDKPRRKQFDLTGPFFPMDTSVFVNASEDDYWNWEELRGIKVGVVRGDAAQVICAKERVKPVLFANYKAAVEALGKGELKAVIMDEPVMLYYRAQLKLGDKIIWPRYPVVHSSDMALPVKKGNHKLLGILKKGLALVSGSQMGKILEQWRGARGIL